MWSPFYCRKNRDENLWERVPKITGIRKACLQSVKLAHSACLSFTDSAYPSIFLVYYFIYFSYINSVIIILLIILISLLFINFITFYIYIYIYILFTHWAQEKVEDFSRLAASIKSSHSIMNGSTQNLGLQLLLLLHINRVIIFFR